MLALGVRFLTGRYYACDFRNRSKPEWPPHPDRLYSALVAAYHRDENETEREALMWLERQNPPSMAVKRPQEVGSGREIYAMVPVNDERADKIKLLPQNRGRQPRFFPSVYVEDPVYFIWNDAVADESVAEALARIASRVTYLGGSMSFVQVWVENNPPAPNLVPDPMGTETLRVPYRGRLEELDWRYISGLRPSLSRQVRYRWADEQATITENPYRSLFTKAYFLARRTGPAPALQATLTITDALRRALLSIADKEYEGVIPSLLHGHENHDVPHCAFVSLPYVGSAYSDGHLLGVGVLFPEQASDDECRKVLRVLGRLEYLDTPAGRIGLEPVVRLRPHLVPWGLKWERWSGPPRGTKTWVSVTPVLFDRFPKRNKGGILGAVEKMAENAGLPQPVRVKTVRFSPVSGVPPASQFRVKRTKNDPPRLVTHLIVTFSKPVVGPVLMGAGRYFGLGMFVPYYDHTSEEVSHIEAEV